MFTAMLLPLAVLLIALGLLVTGPPWFPRTAHIVGAILAGVVIVLILINSGSVR
jgi:hypothetical protein